MCPFSPKFQFYFKKGSSKNFLWASRLWVGRRKEPILGYVPKNDEKNNLVHSFFLITFFFFFWPCRTVLASPIPPVSGYPMPGGPLAPKRDPQTLPAAAPHQMRRVRRASSLPSPCLVRFVCLYKLPSISVIPFKEPHNGVELLWKC